ncbi:hypothetical protein BGW38_004321 [Lunasporangiospora selenospora]|uniref:Uncharacterized protein n=1 Tax=Lunasporangiospora selenospora TaxID=979761 RepID=A0A9P6FQ89_9FUNG|nr:hypothetical protein BGW38_004321 [Lunasporangiospora selenospora]
MAAEAAYKAKVPAKSEAVTLLLTNGLNAILSDLAKLLFNNIKASFKTSESLGALDLLKGQEGKNIREVLDGFLMKNATVQFNANLGSEISAVITKHIGPNGKIDTQGMITDITAIIETHAKKMMDYIDLNIKSYVQEHIHAPSATESLLGNSSAAQGSAGLKIEVYVSAITETIATDQKSALESALAQ